MVQPFTWDVAAGLPLLLADGSASYLYGPGGQILEQVQGTSASYYHADQLGSVRALTDQSGAGVATYSYDAYGQPLTSTGSVANPFRYAGQYQDSESGLYYLRARYYDPVTQQFLTVDPLLAATEQAYNYAAGSPLNATDPSGLCPPDLNPSECIEYLESGGGGGSSVTTDTGVGISAHGTDSLRTTWNYDNGEPSRPRTEIEPASADSSCDLSVTARPSSFRASTMRAVVEDNRAGFRGQLRCEMCGADVAGVMARGAQVRRGYDFGHIVPWSQIRSGLLLLIDRGWPPVTRRDVLEVYNDPENLRIECPACNQSHQWERGP